MKPFGILGWPAYNNRKDNPYNFLVYKNIENWGYPIYDFTFTLNNCIKWAFSGKFKIFHVHWPTYVISTSTYGSAFRHLLAFYFFVKIARLLNKKLVWTVHNLEAHESRFPSLQKKLEQILYRNFDGFISLNEAGVNLIKAKIKRPASQKVIHIQHPHYRNYYQNEISSEAARKELGITPEKFVILFIGQIRPYKNVPGLIKIFNELDKADKFLLIAGSAQREVTEEMEVLINDRSDIKVVNKFIKDEDLQLYLNSADLLVTPYDRIFNSGSLFLNLSFSKPTLAPGLASIPELQKIVGKKWIHTYNGPITSQILKESMELLTQEKSIEDLPDLSAFEPELISRKTANFYQSLLK